MFDGMEVIHTYSRANAIADGTLIEASQKLLDMTGFKYPVAITNGAWTECVAWDVEDSQKQTFQFKVGRFGQVLKAARTAILANKQAQGEIYFTVSVIPRDGISQEANEVKLKVLCHPGDQLEPVLTIMLPYED